MLELLITVMVFGLLATFLLNRLSYYKAAAEKAYVEYCISTMKSGLRLRIAQLMVDGRMREVVQLAESNPMDLLDQKPENYFGETNASQKEIVPNGNWYFDTDAKALGYVMKNVPVLFGKKTQPVQVKLERMADGVYLGIYRSSETAL